MVIHFPSLTSWSLTPWKPERQLFKAVKEQYWTIVQPFLTAYMSIVGILGSSFKYWRYSPVQLRLPWRRKLCPAAGRKREQTIPQPGRCPPRARRPIPVWKDIVQVFVSRGFGSASTFAVSARLEILDKTQIADRAEFSLVEFGLTSGG